jgi:hypothetical protein
MEARMNRQLIKAALALACASLIGAAGYAEPAGTSPTKPAAKDPGEVICKDIDVSGVRFGTKRICATRAEWQAREQGDREAIEQMQRPIQVCNIMGTRRC